MKMIYNSMKQLQLNTKNGIQQPIETSDQFDNFDISLGPKKYNKNSINQGSYPTNDGSTSSGKRSKCAI